MKYPLWIFAFSLLGLVSCRTTPESNPVSGRKNTMVLHLMNDPGGLNPVTTVGATESNLHNLIFDHLIYLDFKTLELTPKLASDLPEISENGRTMTFHLKKGLKFSDGHPISANDVLFSFKAYMNPYVDSAPRRAELINFTDCKVLDDMSVAFMLTDSGPFNLDKFAMNFFVLPKHIYDAEGLSDKYSAKDATLAGKNEAMVTSASIAAMQAFATHFDHEKFQREKGFVIGSGRYMLDFWETEQYVRLVKNPNYWNENDDDPFAMQGMDTLLFKVIPAIESAMQALKSGEIDFSENFEPEQFHSKMDGPDWEKHFEKKSIPYPNYEYIGWNTKIKNAPERNFFSDRNVRWALSYLVDVDNIIKNILGGTAEPITSMVYKDRPEYNRDLKVIQFDPEKAKKLLDESGWIDSDGDGVRDKIVDGKKVNFEFDLCYRRGNDMRRRIGIHVSKNLQKAGIKANVVDLEWSIMLTRLKNHELDAWIGAWVYESNEQDLFSLFHSSQILSKGYNWTSYANPEADKVMEMISKEWDKEKRYTLHSKIQEILYEDQPYTLLYANSARIAFNKRIKTDNWYGQRPCYDPAQFYLAGKE